MKRPTYIHLQTHYVHPPKTKIEAALRKQSRGLAPRAVTVAMVPVDPEGEKIQIGLAFCSTADNFNRATGRSIAKNRALGARKYACTMTAAQAEQARRELFKLWKGHRYVHGPAICKVFGMVYKEHAQCGS